MKIPVSDETTNKGGSSPVTSSSFNALGFGGGDLYYSINETSALAETVGATLIYSISKLVQDIANQREAIQEAQKDALAPIIADINSLSQKGDLDGSDSARLQIDNTKYTDTSTNFQQLQTTAGGLQDGETQSLSSISSSVENFITFIGKLNSILQQTSSLVAN